MTRARLHACGTGFLAMLIGCGRIGFAPMGDANGGERAFDVSTEDAMMLVPCDPTTCPDPGTCNAGVCTFDCTLLSCESVTCPAGMPCAVHCEGTIFPSCTQPIDCSQATSCTVSCRGLGSCSQSITCGDGPCDITCAGGACTSDIDCAQSCACDVSCAGLSCTEPATCPSGCGSGAGCTSAGTCASCP